MRRLILGYRLLGDLGMEAVRPSVRGMRTPFQWAEDQRLDKGIPSSKLLRHKVLRLLGELIWAYCPACKPILRAYAMVCRYVG